MKNGFVCELCLPTYSWTIPNSCFYSREVFKAREKNSTTNKFVAMKKVLMENEKEGVSSISRKLGFPIVSE